MGRQAHGRHGVLVQACSPAVRLMCCMRPGHSARESWALGPACLLAGHVKSSGALGWMHLHLHAAFPRFRARLHVREREVTGGFVNCESKQASLQAEVHSAHDERGRASYAAVHLSVICTREILCILQLPRIPHPLAEISIQNFIRHHLVLSITDIGAHHHKTTEHPPKPHP
jgi:hypothetical protein